MKKFGLAVLSFVVVLMGASSSWALKEHHFLGCYDQNIRNLEYIASQGESLRGEESLSHLGFLRVMSSIRRGLSADEVLRLRVALYSSQSCEEFVSKVLIGTELQSVDAYSSRGNCPTGAMPVRDMLVELDVTTATLLDGSSLELRALQSGKAESLVGGVNCRQMDSRFAAMAIQSLKQGRSFVKDVYDLL